MAGFKVVPVKALSDGSLDLEDLSAKANMYQDNLAAFMVRRRKVSRERSMTTCIVDYVPVNFWSVRGWCTRGVSELLNSCPTGLILNSKACKIIHANGGQVYLDGLCHLDLRDE